MIFWEINGFDKDLNEHAQQSVKVVEQCNNNVNIFFK